MTTKTFKTILYRPAVSSKAPPEYVEGTRVSCRMIGSDRVYTPLSWTPSWKVGFEYELEIPEEPDPVVEFGRNVSLPEDPAIRAEYPIFDGFLAYFPNAVAEVARLSYKATQQHHPDEDMHWDRSKSLDHLNKIGRHMIDAGKVDDNGIRHSVMIAWRAMANLQEELEKQEGYPPSPASRNRPW